MESGGLAFGPVPSRRLGRSLGINNIPAKTCSYSCVYCQVGKTLNMTTRRQSFYLPQIIFQKVRKKANEAKLRNEETNYLTFVSDGEPTLDMKLGEEVSLLKRIGIPIAVITNGSLMHCNDVKGDLLAADYVSFKVDAVNRDLWRRINRPHKTLKLDLILEGIAEFAMDFKGRIVSETMLIDGIDYGNEFEKIADFLQHLEKLDKAYIAVPTRPPTEKWVRPPKEEIMNAAFQIFSSKLGPRKVECLTEYEGNAFASTGEVEQDLLSITAVHPMRREAVEELVRKAGVNWSIVEKLLRTHKLVQSNYEGQTYYLRRLHNPIQTPLSDSQSSTCQDKCAHTGART